MILYSPIRVVMSFWMALAALGFYPVVIYGRVKINNILDIILFCSIIFVFLISMGRIKISFREKGGVSLAFILLSMCWIPGFLLSNNLSFALERYLVFGLMAAAVIFLFWLPRPKKPIFSSGNTWVFIVFVISSLLVISYFSIGVTEYGRVTMPGFEGDSLGYRYVDGVGLLPDPNVLSYGLGLIYIFSLAYSGFRPFIFAVLVLALLFVGSRSALVSFFLAMSFWIFIEGRRDRLFFIFFMVFVFIISFIFFIFDFFGSNVLARFTNPEYYTERFNRWFELWNAYVASGFGVLFGNGFGSARDEFGDPHNFYLAALYDGGMLALVSLFFVYFSVFRYIVIDLCARERSVAYAMLIFNFLIGLFYWQDQIFFVPFFLIWIISIYKRRALKDVC